MFVYGRRFLYKVFLCSWTAFRPRIILISSFGSAITFPHFSHLSVFKGLYIGIKTLTLGSGEGCGTKVLSTSRRFQQPQWRHFIRRFLVITSTLVNSTTERGFRQVVITKLVNGAYFTFRYSVSAHNCS